MKRFLLLLHAAALVAQMSPVFPAGRFYAPYIMPRPTPDLAKGYLSDLSATSGIRYFTLAFIIGNADGSCQATWGGRTPLAQETA